MTDAFAALTAAIRSSRREERALTDARHLERIEACVRALEADPRPCSPERSYDVAGAEARLALTPHPITAALALRLLRLDPHLGRAREIGSQLGQEAAKLAV